MVSMRKAKTICMAYCRNAIMSPTCMLASATWCAPVHKISRDRPFKSSIITGIMMTMTRLTNSMVPVRSLLALSKRFCSNSCLLKARMTIIPDRFSRITRLSRSIRPWMLLNLGTEIEYTINTRPSSTATASAMIHHIVGFLLMARITPPMPMMGA